MPAYRVLGGRPSVEARFEGVKPGLWSSPEAEEEWSCLLSIELSTNIREVSTVVNYASNN